MKHTNNNNHNKPGNISLAGVIRIYNNHASLLKAKTLFLSIVWFPAAGGAAQHLTADQKEIVDTHNEYRRNVKPTASNMLEMVTWEENRPHSVLTRCSLQRFHTALFFLRYTTEMEQWGCSQCSEMGRQVQQELSPQPPKQQEDRQYVHSDQRLTSKKRKKRKENK